MSNVFRTFSTRLSITILVMAAVFMVTISDYAESSMAVDNTQAHLITPEERLRLERQYGLEPPDGSNTREHSVSGGDIGFSIKGFKGSSELVASTLELIRLLIFI